ncbi:MAG TPA: stage V sporulation T C-terminal domain-containing protein [Ruminiclostridium sp.]
MQQAFTNKYKDGANLGIYSSGMVRRIDNLGRIVVPKELRHKMNVINGDPIEMFTDEGGRIILKKYSPIGQFSEFAEQYAQSIAKSVDHMVVITDNHEIVAAFGGESNKNLKKNKLLPEFETLIRGHELKLDKLGKICEEQPDNLVAKAMMPILSNDYDTIGSVIFLSSDNDISMGDIDVKLIRTCADFIGRQYDV